jgi:DNA helicase-2/ATP-dependent DNA helicase PcrA
MSQISELEYKLEEKYLEKVINTLKKEYISIDDQFQKRSDSLKNYRRYLWENRRDFNNLFEIAEYEDRLREDIRGYEVISSRRKVIKNALSSPYFARIDFKEKNADQKEKIYIGLTSIIEKERFNMLVMDWRAPVSSMYYDYELGLAQYEAPKGNIVGEIVLKRQYKIKNAKLRLAVDTGIKIDDLLLLEALSESSNTKMQQIVYTIQQEQNRIIRDTTSNILWIQGVAGSGKTSIALHRVAYLLYHNRKKIDSSNIAIFSPHPVFSDYISNVLPELGESNANQLTFFDYGVSKISKEFSALDISEQYLAMESNNEKRINSIRYKSSFDYLEVMNKYVKYLENKKWNFKDTIFAGINVFSAKEIEDLFNNKYSDIPLSKRLDQVVNRIIYLVSMKFKKVNEPRLKATIYENAPNIDAISLYRELFAKTELREKIGVSNLPENFSSICKETLEMMDNKKLYFEDLSPILYLKHMVEKPLTDNSLKHIVIDEVQTYSGLQLKILKEIFSEAKFTFLGDVYQNMNPFISWNIEDIKEILDDDITYYYLNTCYRSTKEIAKLAESICPESGINYIDRVGRKPQLKVVDKNRLYQELTMLIDDVKTRDNESYAIITNSLKEAKQLEDILSEYDAKLITGNSRELSKDINILPAHVIKGLEFDSVIFLNQKQIGQKDKSYLYTIVSRALHEFNILTTERMDILEEPINKGLINEQD